MKKLFLLALIILLYGYAFFVRSTENVFLLENSRIADESGVPADEKPFYKEGFVTPDDISGIRHVSSISPAGENMMACVWYQGSREGAKDVAIFLSFYDEKKGVWTEPIILVDRKSASAELSRYVKKVGNPLIFRDKTGRLWLFYSTVAFGGWSGSTLNYKMSIDGGLTWSKSRKMLLSPFFNLTNNVKNKGINLDDGSFIIPVYHEFLNKFSELIHVIPLNNNIIFVKHKMTWQDKAIQPAIMHEGSRKLAAFFRNGGKGPLKYVLSAGSMDMGRTWSGLTETSLPNPDSGLDMTALSNGTFLGLINNSFGNRNNLTMVISHDKGRTWQTLKVLEDKSGKEYSYPSIIRSDNGFLHVTYTYERRKIRHIIFNEAWIRTLR